MRAGEERRRDSAFVQGCGWERGGGRAALRSRNRKSSLRSRSARIGNSRDEVVRRRRDGRMRRRGRGYRGGRRGYRGGRGALWRGGVASGIDAGAGHSRVVADSCFAIGERRETLVESDRAEVGGRTRRQS